MQTKTFFQKYELPLFFLLAYLLSWSSIPFANGGILPQGPALAAVIVIALAAGRQGLREFWSRLTNFRAGWWYLVGPVIVAAYLLASFLVNVWMGAAVANPFPFPSAATILTLLLMGGLWEEPGWTGYALPKFEERFANLPYGNLAAALTTGFFRAIWHLPLVLSGAIAWYDMAIFSFAIQIIIAWLYHRSGRSVPAVMAFHYASNLIGGGMFVQAFSGIDHERFYVLFVAFGCLTALVILLATKFKLGVASSRKPASRLETDSPGMAN